MESGDPTIEELFDSFLYSDQTLEESLNKFHRVKNELQLNDIEHHLFFSKLKEHFTSWRVTSFLEILQRRCNVKEYARSVKNCKTCSIFVIGAGPCGLRFAIEAALCGARVVVVEKRNSFTRNNVLHLWPYLIHDLRNIGMKKLYGKFCAGSLDHISIRRLQIILVKIALVLGVDMYTKTSFVEYLEPCNSTGWRISVKPSNYHIESMDFDVLVGADGKRNSIPGFQRKEFRAKLAIGITANFVNNHTEDEARIEEISGVAALFNQKFFADLKSETDIELENIVYYKDDTHYFVMTAKKSCLLKKGVLKKDENDVMNLLSYDNVDERQLHNLVRQAADFSTGLPHDKLAIDPDNGRTDVAIFDFTSMYSAEYAAKIIDRRSRRLVIGLVGDGLMEPFWPLGTGCARGFLSCMDLMWMITRQQEGASPEDLLKERMALYQLLHQTSNDNMYKKHSTYTLNPKSRYRIIPKYSDDVSFLYDQDGKKATIATSIVDTPTKRSRSKRKLTGETTETVHKQWKKSTYARTRKPKNPTSSDVFKKKRSVSPKSQKPVENQDSLLQWCKVKLKPVCPFIPIMDLDACWRDGVLLCGLVHLCSPKDINMNLVKNNSDHANVELAISVMCNEFGIQPLTADDVLPPVGPDLLAIMSTIVELKKVYEDTVAPPSKPAPTSAKRAPKTDTSKPDPSSPKRMRTIASFDTQLDLTPVKGPGRDVVSHAPAASAMDVTPQPGSLKKRVTSQRKLRKKTESKFLAQVDNPTLPSQSKVATLGRGSHKCHTCTESVLILKRVSVEGYVFHRKCFKCEECYTPLKTSTYHLITPTNPALPGIFYCKTHFNDVLTTSKNKLTTPSKTPAKPPRPHPRPQSTSLEKLQLNHSPARSMSPTIREEVPEDTSRYNDTAQQIHRSEKISKFKTVTKPTATKVTIIDTGKRERAISRSPSARSGKSKAPSPPTRPQDPNIIRQTPDIAKKLAFKDELPTEMPSENSMSNTQPRHNTSMDVLPQESLPTRPIDTTNITTRKKSKKQRFADDQTSQSLSAATNKMLRKHVRDQYEESPCSLSSATQKTFFRKHDKSSKNYISDDLRHTRMISQSAVSLSPPPKHRVLIKGDENRGSPVAGRGRLVNDALHGARMTSRAAPRGIEPEPRDQPRSDRHLPSTPLSSRPPVTRHKLGHVRAGSMDDLDKYLPRQKKTSIRKKEDDNPPLSVKDRIAFYHESQTASSFSVGDKKRLVVSPDLQRSVNRDRINLSRTPQDTEIDGSPSGPAITPNTATRKKRRLRLKPTTKQNQRRLEQAQIIQRDRSQLEQKLVEFENHAATIERQLRAAGNDDKDLLSQFLELVNIKNDLTRRENELHLCEKYLQLLDEQDQIERDLRYLIEMNEQEKTEGDRDEEEKMILRKFDVVNRRDCLLMQLDNDKRREEEEDEQINAMLSEKGMSSNQFGYNTDNIITIETLLEVDDDCYESDNEVEPCLELFEQSCEVQKRDKHKRNATEENALSKFFNRLSFFN